jgi:hypothetical protein
MVGRWPCGHQQLHLLPSRGSQMGRCASIWEQKSAKANGESLANGMVVPILKYIGPSPPFAGFSPLGILVLLRSSRGKTPEAPLQLRQQKKLAIHLRYDPMLHSQA